MKKVFSLILAVAMVLSLASVAFAADLKPWTEKSSGSSKDAAEVKLYDNTVFYTYGSDDHVFTSASNKTPTFGKVIYYPLFVSKSTVATEDKSVSSLKLVANIEEGAAYVKSVDIVKKYGKDTDTDGFKGYDAKTATKTNFFNGYYIAITTQGSATGVKDVSGILTLTGKTGSGSTKLKDEAVHFAFKLGWAAAVTSTDNNKYAVNGTGAAKTNKLDTTYVVTGRDAETIFTFGKDVTFTVDMVKDEKVVLKFNDDVVKAIEDANEEAGISFMNFNNTTFKRSGDLLVPADDEEPGYMYEILADGSLKDISSTYNEEEGGFFFKAKKLGKYCLSDLPLVDAEGTVAAAPGAVNPVTGAIA